MLLVVHADERFGGRASVVPVIADEDDVEPAAAADFTSAGRTSQLPSVVLRERPGGALSIRKTP